MDIATKVAEKLAKNRLVYLEVSARHVHFSKSDYELLFGKYAEPVAMRELSQPNQFLCDKRVTLVGKKGKIEKVAVLGPFRDATQIELSKSDCIALGIDAPLRQSGDLANSASLIIEGEVGKIELKQGAIIALAHVHVDTGTAMKMGVYDGQIVSTKLLTDRPVTLNNVVIRISDNYSTAMHIDFDEANSACVSGFNLAKILC